MKIAFKNQAKRLLHNMPPRWVCRMEYQRQSFTEFNERPVEFAFVFRQLARLYPKTVLDVGTGTTALPHLMRNCGCLVTATDNIRDYWPAGMTNRHYHVIDDDITASQLQERFDLITCISVLEHIENYDAAIHNMFGRLNPNGYLILTFPFTESQFHENVYALPGSNLYGKDTPYICRSYSRNKLHGWLMSHGATISEQEYWQYWTGDFWRIGRQIIPPRQVSREEKHQLTCLLIQGPAPR